MGQEFFDVGPEDQTLEKPQTLQMREKRWYSLHLKWTKSSLGHNFLVRDIKNDLST